MEEFENKLLCKHHYSYKFCKQCKKTDKPEKF